MNGYRVRRPKQFENFLNSLTDKDNGVFSTYKSALMFAAAYGFKHGKRVEFQDSSERINLSIFDINNDIPFMYSMALTILKDVSYLQDKDEKFYEVMKIFEEYAAGGLSLLEGALDPLNLTESILSRLHEEDDPLVGITGDDWLNH